MRRWILDLPARPTDPEVIGQIGAGSIMGGSDYPNRDGVRPNSQQVIREDLGHLNH